MELWQIAFRKLEKLFKRSTLVELREAIIRNDPRLIKYYSVIPDPILGEDADVEFMCPVCYLIHVEGETKVQRILDLFNKIVDKSIYPFIAWVDTTHNYKELLMEEVDLAIDRRDQ